MNLAGLKPLIFLLLQVPLSLPCLANGPTERQCEDFEPVLETDVAELGDIRIHRGSYDIEGARLVGCIRNTGDEALDGAGLIFNQIQSRGGGGGTTALLFESLQPGQAGGFVSHAFRPDRERLEEWGITGIELRALQLRDGMELAEHAFSDQLELDYPIRELPDSDLRQACTALSPTDPDSKVTLEKLRMIEVTGGEVRVAGCIVNGGDEVLADDRQNGVRIEYSGEPGEDYDGTMHWGGSGQLNLPGALEPGSADLSVADFEVEDKIARVEIRLTERVDHDGFYQYEAVGPAYAVER